MAFAGDRLVELIHALEDETERMVVLARHSAREFNRDRHDLLNPLTDEGRDLARRLGQAIPAGFHVRGYASPPERCMETAELALAGYQERGGSVGRHRAVEGLGVFYALDQRRMWKAMSKVVEPGGSFGLAGFVSAWGAGEMSSDTMMPADLAAQMVLEVLKGKLRQQGEGPQIDLCVSHDLTIMMLRHQLLGLVPEDWPVEFLDGVVLFEKDGELSLASDTGHRIQV